MFKNAIVKTPCKNIANGLSEAKLGIPDFERALEQHKNYIKALESCGLSVLILDPDDNFPDSTFIEDACLVTPKCAVITNPGAASRKKEAQKIAKTIQSLDRPFEFIKEPGTLDAGDVMMVENHYYVGLSQRTNQQGADQLNDILKNYGMTSSVVTLDTMLHLKTGVSYLENNNLLAFGELVSKPEFIKFNIIEVDEDEGYAANSVWINDFVLVPTGFPKTFEKIKAAGYKPIEVDVFEFRKLDGGLSCLSLRY
ncbi:MAG: N(G),N(G)-dimethylarginine dimethylaminohydrolase [Desulfobacteraceae bacterium]|nr:N(G),N(G)-dimethylarginine dimethylaminohydrolase [Desulfobacteraceae bacterium]